MTPFYRTISDIAFSVEKNIRNSHKKNNCISLAISLYEKFIKCGIYSEIQEYDTNRFIKSENRQMKHYLCVVKSFDESYYIENNSVINWFSTPKAYIYIANNQFSWSNMHIDDGSIHKPGNDIFHKCPMNCSRISKPIEITSVLSTSADINELKSIAETRKLYFINQKE